MVLGKSPNLSIYGAISEKSNVKQKVVTVYSKIAVIKNNIHIISYYTLLLFKYYYFSTLQILKKWNLYRSSDFSKATQKVRGIVRFPDYSVCLCITTLPPMPTAEFNGLKKYLTSPDLVHGLASAVPCDVS